MPSARARFAAKDVQPTLFFVFTVQRIKLSSVHRVKLSPVHRVKLSPVHWVKLRPVHRIKLSSTHPVKLTPYAPGQADFSPFSYALISLLHFFSSNFPSSMFSFVLGVDRFFSFVLCDKVLDLFLHLSDTHPFFAFEENKIAKSQLKTSEVHRSDKAHKIHGPSLLSHFLWI